MTGPKQVALPLVIALLTACDTTPADRDRSRPQDAPANQAVEYLLTSAASQCGDSTVQWDEGDLSSSLQRRLDSLR